MDLFLRIDEHPVESRLFSFAKSLSMIQQFSGCARSFFTVNLQRRHPVYLSSKRVTARSDGRGDAFTLSRATAQPPRTERVL
jgi:hypothetical protein